MASEEQPASATNNRSDSSDSDDSSDEDSSTSSSSASSDEETETKADAKPETDNTEDKDGENGAGESVESEQEEKDDHEEEKGESETDEKADSDQEKEEESKDEKEASQDEKEASEQEESSAEEASGNSSSEAEGDDEEEEEGDEEEEEEDEEEEESAQTESDIRETPDTTESRHKQDGKTGEETQQDSPGSPDSSKAPSVDDDDEGQGREHPETERPSKSMRVSPIKIKLSPGSHNSPRSVGACIISPVKEDPPHVDGAELRARKSKPRTLGYIIPQPSGQERESQSSPLEDIRVVTHKQISSESGEPEISWNIKHEKESVDDMPQLKIQTVQGSYQRQHPANNDVIAIDDDDDAMPQLKLQGMSGSGPSGVSSSGARIGKADAPGSPNTPRMKSILRKDIIQASHRSTPSPSSPLVDKPASGHRPLITMFGLSKTCRRLTEDGSLESYKEYFCNFCLTRTENEQAFIDHINTHIFVCGLCSFQAFLRMDMVTHIIRKHPDMSGDLSRLQGLHSDHMNRETPDASPSQQPAPCSWSNVLEGIDPLLQKVPKKVTKSDVSSRLVSAASTSSLVTSSTDSYNRNESSDTNIIKFKPTPILMPVKSQSSAKQQRAVVKTPEPPAMKSWREYPNTKFDELLDCTNAKCSFQTHDRDVIMEHEKSHQPNYKVPAMLKCELMCPYCQVLQKSVEMMRIHISHYHTDLPMKIVYGVQCAKAVRLFWLCASCSFCRNEVGKSEIADHVRNSHEDDDMIEQAEQIGEKNFEMYMMNLWRRAFGLAPNKPIIFSVKDDSTANNDVSEKKSPRAKQKKSTKAPTEAPSTDENLQTLQSPETSSENEANISPRGRIRVKQGQRLPGRKSAAQNEVSASPIPPAVGSIHIKEEPVEDIVLPRKAPNRKAPSVMKNLSRDQQRSKYKSLLEKAQIVVRDHVPENFKIDPRQYLVTDPETKSVSCTECNAEFISKNAMSHATEHVSSHFGIKIWACPYCGEQRNRRLQIITHVAACHQNDPLVVVRLRPYTESALKAQRNSALFEAKKDPEKRSRSESTSKPDKNQFFTCPFCSRRHPNLSVMSRHLKYAHGGKDFSLDQIPKESESEVEMDHDSIRSQGQNAKVVLNRIDGDQITMTDFMEATSTTLEPTAPPVAVNDEIKPQEKKPPPMSPNGKYQCSYCDYLGRNCAYVKRHIFAIHPNDELVARDLRSSRSRSQERLLYICPSCEFFTPVMNALHVHAERNPSHFPGTDVIESEVESAQRQLFRDCKSFEKGVDYENIIPSKKPRLSLSEPPIPPPPVIPSEPTQPPKKYVAKKSTAKGHIPLKHLTAAINNKPYMEDVMKSDGLGSLDKNWQQSFFCELCDGIQRRGVESMRMHMQDVHPDHPLTALDGTNNLLYLCPIEGCEFCSEKEEDLTAHLTDHRDTEETEQQEESDESEEEEEVVEATVQYSRTASRRRITPIRGKAQDSSTPGSVNSRLRALQSAIGQKSKAASKSPATKGAAKTAGKSTRPYHPQGQYAGVDCVTQQFWCRHCAWKDNDKDDARSHMVNEHPDEIQEVRDQRAYVLRKKSRLHFCKFKQCRFTTLNPDQYESHRCWSVNMEGFLECAYCSFSSDDTDCMEDHLTNHELALPAKVHRRSKSKATPTKTSPRKKKAGKKNPEIYIDYDGPTDEDDDEA